MVVSHNKSALKFLGLENATKDELAKLECLPIVKEFHNGFITHSPFDDKLELTVEFIDSNEE